MPAPKNPNAATTKTPMPAPKNTNAATAKTPMPASKNTNAATAKTPMPAHASWPRPSAYTREFRVNCDNAVNGHKALCPLSR